MEISGIPVIYLNLIYGFLYLAFGASVLGIMLISRKHIGNLAFLMIPLIAHSILWSSWRSVRSQWIFDKFYENNLSLYQIYEVIDFVFALIVFILALLPICIKRSQSPL